jgi:hypothetical protein
MSDVQAGFQSFVRAGVICPELCYLVSAAVGFPVSIYWASGSLLGLPKEQYQVMRWDESPGAGKAFWDWYLANRKQFYPTPEAASVAFVQAWLEWDRKGAI